MLATPAFAQGILSPYAITSTVQSMGLEPISPPVQRGARYVLRAIDGRGIEVRVAADAWTGRILAVRPMGEGRGSVYANRYAPPSYYSDENAPAPRSGYEPPANYDRQGSYYGQPQTEQRGSYQGQPRYEQRGNYDGQSSRTPGDPAVIYAPRDNTTAPQAPSRAPTAAKPAAPKVAARPPVAKPAESVEAPKEALKSESVKSESAKPESPKPESKADAKTKPQTDATNASAALKPAPAENPALKAPQVQAFD